MANRYYQMLLASLLKCQENNKRRQRESENKYSLLEIRKVIEPHMEILKNICSDYSIQLCLKMKTWVNDYFLGKEITRFDSKSSSKFLNKHTSLQEVEMVIKELLPTMAQGPGGLILTNLQGTDIFHATSIIPEHSKEWKVLTSFHSIRIALIQKAI